MFKTDFLNFKKSLPRIPYVWLEIKGGKIDQEEPFSCEHFKSGPHLRLGGKEVCEADCGVRAATTSGVSVTSGSYVSFNLFADCLTDSDVQSCHGLCCS